MPQYIRAFFPGGSFFLGVTLLAFPDMWEVVFIHLTAR